MGKPKKVFRKRKRSSGVDKEKDAIPNTATSRALVVDDMVVCDILSRLPVKPLMRFKCVSKHWCSLIIDSCFIDLHFRTSKAPARLLFLMPPKSQLKNKSAGISYQEVCFKTADLLSEVTGKAIPTVHTIRTSKSFERTDILGAINGLICFTNKFEDSVCIYNISTREVLPLVKSTSRDYVIGGVKNDSLVYGFGFDPATKHYKVICNWRVNTKNDNQISVGHFWEVLNLGTNSWRRIEDVPPIPDGLTSSDIYVNGSIYWFPNEFESGIVAFDVGSEKFRKIQIPQVIVDRFGYYYYLLPGCVRIQEVKGCLAISCSFNFAVELWIHERSIKQTPVAVLLKSVCLFFSYNWQDKTFQKMKISGIPSSATVLLVF
ncbi:putative F-box protein At4g38870 [Papaver somniferum]|uniref:putative F-box protein At4g38870 n=1 Tax=Papaver somniferum TaxID=3469 RepID=UPI000E6F7B79|nr:putative F-box protein At4g38870 [Papaver somniferum]